MKKIEKSVHRDAAFGLIFVACLTILVLFLIHSSDDLDCRKQVALLTCDVLGYADAEYVGDFGGGRLNSYCYNSSFDRHSGKESRTKYYFTETEYEFFQRWHYKQGICKLKR